MGCDTRRRSNSETRHTEEKGQERQQEQEHDQELGTECEQQSEEQPEQAEQEQEQEGGEDEEEEGEWQQQQQQQQRQQQHRHSDQDQDQDQDHEQDQEREQDRDQERDQERGRGTSIHDTPTDNISMQSLACGASDVPSDNRPNSYPASGQTLVPFLPRSSPQNSFVAATTYSTALQSHSPQSRLASQTPQVIGNSPFASVSSRLNPYTSPSLVRVNSDFQHSLSSGPTLWPFRNRHEALLIHHYIINLSVQFDACDDQRHFSREIPRRAQHHSIIKNAIFALSSRHLNVLSGSEGNESHEYVSDCLQNLIPALEDPLSHLDENLLAAVILLRAEEEMSDNDERCHLLGVTRILNSIASFAADGGLRESASWISLRQHIYVALTSQRQLPINLTNYRHSTVFQRSDDEAWANRVIFIFASILTRVFLPEGEQLSPGQWDDLDSQVTTWNLTKPWHFSPLYMEASCQSPDSGTPSWSSWPEILVCNPAQVVGLQHYYLARIVLAIHNPRLSRLTFESCRLRRSLEHEVRDNLRMVVGLAVSNSHVHTGMFHASHALSVCGMYLVDAQEQEAAVDFLLSMETNVGWQTQHIIQNLRGQWQLSST